jgi:hypothetical protein
VIADEQAAHGNGPGEFDFQLKNSADVTRGALQPQSALAATGIFGAEGQAQQKNIQRQQHFAAKPEEPSDNAKWVLAQSFHARVSNGVSAAVNS